MWLAQPPLCPLYTLVGPYALCILSKCLPLLLCKAGWMMVTRQPIMAASPWGAQSGWTVIHYHLLFSCNTQTTKARRSFGWEGSLTETRKHLLLQEMPPQCHRIYMLFQLLQEVRLLIIIQIIPLVISKLSLLLQKQVCSTPVLIYYATTLLYKYWAQEPIRGTQHKIKVRQRSTFSLFGLRGLAVM